MTTPDMAGRLSVREPEPKPQPDCCHDLLDELLASLQQIRSEMEERLAAIERGAPR
ncbi:hypothetical protein [Streptomyces hoynatensis]|uniref:hypothetical protein n=1 Tax=Streptomyces hoynatensis TaxID=1141874 RepID=UPI00131A2ABA|nr:hypothetical protein [Streptomyces hoynatensis]